MNDRIERFDLRGKRILVTGARGLVGRSLIPRLGVTVLDQRNHSNK